jgi:hypothetical protein
MTSRPLVIKADGVAEPFESEKLIRSLTRSGASASAVQNVVSQVEAELSDGMTTEDIYRYARSLLKKQHEKVAVAKYSLRRALFSLGPTGFPFEDFLARLFETRGYTTRTGALLRGTCVEHEVDLIAHNKDHCFIAEAKFHARPGVKSDLQVALYSHARFLDLRGKAAPGAHCPINEGYIITNTKFTKAAIEYADCVGLKLISWDHPKDKTLQDYIEEAGIYPITALPSLTMREKQALLMNGVVLCKDMPEKRDVLRAAGIAPHKIETIIEEGVNLCRS